MNDEPQQNDSPAQQADEKAPEPIATIKCEKTSDKCHRAQEQAHWAHEKRINKVTVGVAGGALIAAIISAYLSNQALKAAIRAANEAARQADSAEDQVKIQADTEKRQLRAYVYVIPQMSPLEVGKSPRVQVVVVNGGDTPAYRITPSIHFQDGPMPKQGEHIVPPDFTPEVIPTEWGSDFVYKDKRYTFTVPNIPILEQPLFNEIMALRRRSLFVWGRISYQDVFKRTHWVDFCAFGPGPPTMENGGYCHEHNDVDYEDQK